MWFILPLDLNDDRDLAFENFFSDVFIFRIVIHIVKVKFLIKHFIPWTILLSSRILIWISGGVYLGKIKVVDDVEECGSNVHLLIVSIPQTTALLVIDYLKPD